ncbi:MAG: nitrilase-related carbon-nitrogen hydrolase [Candidatus Hodarchaeales archaeon]
MSLKQIQKLIWKSRIDEALQKIENLPEEDRLKGLVYKSISLTQKNDLDNALLIIEQILIDNPQVLTHTLEFSARIAKITALMKARRFIEAYPEIDSCEKLLDNINLEDRSEIKEWEGRLYAIKAGFQLTGGELRQAITSFQKCLALFEEIKYNEALYNQLNNLGWLYRVLGELNRALDCFNKQLIISLEINNKKWIAWTKFNIGYIHYYKGELNQAFNYSKDSEGLFQELNDKNGLSHVYLIIGSIHRGKGDLPKSLECYNRIFEFYKIDLEAQKAVPHSVCVGLRDLGVVNLYKNQVEESFDYFLKAIDTHKSLCRYRNSIYDFEIVLTSFWLIYLCIESNNFFPVENILDDIKQTVEKWPFLKNISEAAEALILKSKSRSTDKIKAQQIFQDILDEKFDYEFEFVIQINLCELLLDELKLYGEQEVIQEIQSLLARISNIALKQRSITSLVTLYSLQAKLALIEGDVEHSNSLLNRAETIAIKKGFNLLSLKIRKQIEELSDQLNEWKALLARNSTLQESIDFRNLKKYIEMVNLQFPGLERKFESKKKFELIYKDMLLNSSKIQKGKFRVGISQIGVSKYGNILKEFYCEKKTGLFSLKEEQVENVLEKVKNMTETASIMGVNILLFPELAIDLNYKLLSKTLEKLSRKYDMYIIPGSYHCQDSNQNICKVISPDGILWEQQKHIPAIINLEGKNIQEAINVDSYPQKTIVCNTEYGRIAIAICRDFLDLDLRVELKNFEPPVDLIFNPAFSPVTADFRAAHFDARRSIYAYCFFANIAEFGDSLIYTPEKEKVSREIPKRKEELIYKDVDVFNLRSERKKWDLKRKEGKMYIQSTKH